MPGQRTYAPGSYGLELDGKHVGPLKAFSGGEAYADVYAEAGRSYFAKKHVANLRYAPITIQVGFTLEKAFYDWIASAWTGKPTAKDGAVVEADGTAVVRARREFSRALLTEVTIPACDGAAKEAGYLTVKLTPEQTSLAKGSGKAPSAAAKQKLWVASNFRLELDGLDTKKVSKVDSFTVKVGTTVESPGARRAARSAKVEFPNLRVTLAASGAQTWLDWFDDFVLKGHNGDADEKSGTLHFLAPNLKDGLGQVRLFNLGIFRLATETTGTTAVQRVVADLYCERMELAVP